MEEIHEECGVFGVFDNEERDVARLSYLALTALQHRGQESAGIAVNKDRIIECIKDIGLVGEVFTKERLASFDKGKMAVGHVRYSTTGASVKENAQPMLVKHIKGQMALVHNGNLTNSKRLKDDLEKKGCIFHTSSDTEVISYIVTRERINSKSIEEAVAKTMNLIKGAYALVVMSPAKLIAARDPWGFKPLCMGRLESGGVVFASESCALDSVGAEFERDILPGEIVIVENGEVRSDLRHCKESKESAFCIFEHIYFARPDSKIDGASVHDFRVKSGESLFRENPVDADVVIGVPDSGLDAALGFSMASGIPYDIGLVKNKYIGRSFIAPEQKERENMVRLKLGVVRSVLNGKRVIVIDDSIVRGTTSKKIVKLIRDAGASEVHMRISSPPFLNPCYYGTDVDSRENLIAVKYSIPDICEFIGADSLAFMSVPSVKDILKELKEKNPESSTFEFKGCCAACFDGIYRDLD